MIVWVFRGGVWAGGIGGRERQGLQAGGQRERRKTRRKNLAWYRKRKPFLATNEALKLKIWEGAWLYLASQNSTSILKINLSTKGYGREESPNTW